MTIASSTLKLDESSIVASPITGYTSNYIPADITLEPSYCTLPPDNTISFTPLPLTDLNQVCKFTFPQTIAPPPVFIPKVQFPTSCTTFNGSVIVNTSSSSSQISVTGASSTVNSSAPGCGFTSVLQLALSAPTFCSEFTAGGGISFIGTDQISVLGGVSLTPNTVPSCGATLGGQIKLQHPDFCSSFSSGGAVTVTGTGSVSITGDGITLSPAQPPNCGVALGGNINIHVPSACGSFGFSSNVNIIPKSSTPSHISIDGNITGSSSGCGGAISGDVQVGLAGTALDATKIVLCNLQGNHRFRTVTATLKLDGTQQVQTVELLPAKSFPHAPDDAAMTNTIADCLCSSLVSICTTDDSNNIVVKTIRVYEDCNQFWSQYPHEHS